MKYFNQSAFRPSSIERFSKCNLHSILPEEEKDPKTLAYLQERIDDHSRLEKEEFLPTEKNCEAFFRKVKELCGNNFFKEKHMKKDVGFQVLLEGTADVCGYCEKAKTLYVLDYKTGRVFVNAVDNFQLMAYGFLAKDLFPFDDVEYISMSILNTQSDRVSTHVVKFDDVFLSHLGKMQEYIEEDKVVAQKGNHCTFCPSKNYCPLQKNTKTVKKYFDLDTDNLLLETKLRAKELSSRIDQIVQGEESFLSSYLKKTVRRAVKPDAVDALPEECFERKIKTLSKLTEILGKEKLESICESKEFTTLAIKGKN